MPEMPANLTALKNQLSQPGAWVWLLTIVLPDSGGTLRYAANTEDVVYGGNTYSAFNFSIGSFNCDSGGEIPEFSMSVTNVGYVLQDYMRTYNGLMGGTISFVQVNTTYLSEDYSEDVVTLTIVGTDNQWPDVQFTLGVPSAVRYRVPEDRFNPHSCRHKFKCTRCGYTGVLTTCNRNPDDCSTRGRFPANYGGPLSLRREAVRYA
jgi:phage-related protein